MQWPELTLRGLDIVAWPLTVIFIVMLFRVPLSRLIERTVRARGPGGIEATFGEQQPLLEEVKSLPETGEIEELKRDREKQAKEREEALSKEKTQSEKIQALQQEVARLQDFLNRYAADYGRLAQYTEELEYDYLNRAYTLPTKKLLSWIAQRGATNQMAVAARASELEIPPGNIQTTFNALARFHMIRSEGEVVRITEKGKRFANYMREHAGFWGRLAGL